MTGADLIHLAEDLARCGGIHRLTNCIAAAVHVFAEHERRAARTVEAWEDGPEEYGAGMSDKTVRSGAPSRAPAGDEASGGICGADEARGQKSIDLQTTAPAMCNPAPLSPERGERMPVPCGGITHGAGSPVAERHSGPSDMAKRLVPRNPAAELGDMA